MQFHNRLFSSYRGASLMELVVAMGLVGIMSLAGANLSQLTSDVTASSRVKSNWNGFVAVLSERVRYPDQCRQTLQLPIAYTMGNNFNATQEVRLLVPNLQAGPGLNSNLAEAGVNIIPLGISVEHILLVNPVEVTDPLAPPPPPPALPTRTFLALLQIEGRAVRQKLQTGNNDAGASLRTRPIGAMLLEVDNTNSIIGCRTDQVVGMREMCEKIGCVYNQALPQPCDCPDKPLSACPPGTFPTGTIGDSGALDCKKWGGLCDVGFVMTGGQLATAADPLGKPTCAPDVKWVPPVQVGPPVAPPIIVGPACIADGSPSSLEINFGGPSDFFGGFPVVAIPECCSGSGWYREPSCLNCYPPDTIAVCGPRVFNGACGAANGGSFVNAAAVTAAGLCSSGNASALAGAGPWTWTCSGGGGGSNANCSANIAAAPPPCVADGDLVAPGDESAIPCPAGPGGWVATSNFSCCAAGNPNARALCPALVLAQPSLERPTRCGISPPPGCAVWNPVTLACLESSCPAANSPCAPAGWNDGIVDKCGCAPNMADPTRSLSWRCNATGQVQRTTHSPGGC